LSELKRIRISIKGIVQGVGFRPTTYRYAQEFNLSGFVMNTAEGVTIEVEGLEQSLNSFLKKLQEHPPKLAKITNIVTEHIAPICETDFLIITSKDIGNKETEISPDICVCEDCVKDIFDPKNRRYLYPFTNCTNCGPRFSIIKDRPYDRAKTSMLGFKMCPDCEKEYNDPNNRRFHAQPNACPKCGPELILLNAKGVFSLGNLALNNLIDKIKKGGICAIKGIGGFNIACDPNNKETVRRLRKLKDRPSKSFAMMMKDIETVKRVCIVSKAEELLLLSHAAPVVIMRKKDHVLDHISPDNNYYGVMLPYTPLHKILFNSFDTLIMTSANKRDEPIVINDEEINDLLDVGFFDFALTNNREIVNRCDDSIVTVVDNETMLIRRARGYVPTAINVKGAVSTNNLSLGSDLKNTFAIKTGEKVYLSQYIGDLEDDRNYEYQKEEIDIFTKLLNFKVSDINTDAHPLYQNNEKSYKKIYHHHAHAISAMAEHGLLGEKVLAIVCDGTGYGTDGNIWGFEFLDIYNDYRKFDRAAHLKYFYLPGGEKAVIEIDRIARVLMKEEVSISINCPKTSSLGRLFDGVTSICGLLHKVSYEAKAAILLQQRAENFNKTRFTNPKYRVLWIADELDFDPMIQGMQDDIKDSVSIEEIAYKFHIWVVDAIIEFIKDRPVEEKIVFSGGCFQNILLCKLLKQKLIDNGFKKVYFNNIVPTNDGAISFGQAMF